MHHKSELFQLFDWMTEQDNQCELFFDYFNWTACFIGYYVKHFNVSLSSTANWLEYFNLTSEHFIEMFCNIKLSDDTEHDLQFHIERIKKYIKDNNL